MSGRGYNTFHGFDNGPPPPGFAPAQPGGASQYAGFFPQAIPNFGWPALPAPVPMAAPVSFPQQIMVPYSGFGMGIGGQTYTTAAPATDHSFPGIHLRNHTGGIGLPPGYNYAFPREHCKIHVFKTKTKPWQTTVWAQDNSTHVKLLVPVRTTIKELMQNLGCNNEVAKNNVLYEVVEKGNGAWSSGLRISGDDKDRVKKCIEDVGWNKSRTGHVGENPVVWLWLSKDGQ